MNRRSFFLQRDELRQTDRYVLFHENQLVVRNGEFVWDHAQIDSLLGNDFELLVVEDSDDAALVAVKGPAGNRGAPSISIAANFTASTSANC